MRCTVDHSTAIIKNVRKRREETRWTAWLAAVSRMPAIASTVGHG
jgi:hypothetical protein